MIDVLNPIFNVPPPKFEKVSLTRLYECKREFANNFRTYRELAFPRLTMFIPQAHMTYTAARHLEQGIIPETITIATLKRYAKLFDCTLIILFEEEFDDDYPLVGLLQYGIIPIFRK